MRLLSSPARWLVVGMAVAGLSLGGAAQGADRKANKYTPGQQELLAADDAERQAILHADLDKLGELWSDDLRMNAPDNKLHTKALLLGRVKDLKVTYSSFERKVEHVQVLGDTGLVMGREIAVATGGRSDSPQRTERRFINVWLKQNGRWALVARQSSLTKS